MFPSSHLECSSTSVGRPGYCHSPVLAFKNVDARHPILLDVSSDGVKYLNYASYKSTLRCTLSSTVLNGAR